MTRERDAFDLFAEPERGRFGDNESEDRRGQSQRVNGASDLVDIKCLLREDHPSSIAVNLPGKPRDKWIFLPKSQVEFVCSRGEIEVTLPRWLAEEKGLL
jgi:hypothetical protein